MYPELRSALFVQANLVMLDVLALLILLAGMALVYRSFREKYLVPWMSGWAVYTGAKILLALGMFHQGPSLWTGLGRIVFPAAVGLLSAAVLYYVRQSQLLLPVAIASGLAMILAGAEMPLPSWSPVLGLLYAFVWRFGLWIAVFALIRHFQGRLSAGSWTLAVMLLLLHLDRGPLQHIIANYRLPLDLVVDLLLGVGMTIMVFDDSRAQIERMNALNRISRVISDSDDFEPVADAALGELMRSCGAKAAWFRALKDEKLQIVVQRGLDESATRQLRDIDQNSSKSGRALREGEVTLLRIEDVPPEDCALLRQLGFHHLMVVPVIGKNAPIGVLVLGQGGARSYSEDEKNFLKSAASQLGLAAENNQLVRQLVHSQSEWASAFNSISDYVLVHDSQYRVLRANRALLTRLQLPYTRVVLQPCEAVLPGGGITWKECPYCAETAPANDKDPCFGGYCVVSTSAYSGRDSAGGRVHVIKDVTGERIAEERYKILFDQMQEGVFVSSPEGRILDCNNAFLHMLDYSSKEEMLTIDAARSLYANPDDRGKFLAEMASHGFVRNFEYVMRRRDGQYITVIESSFATMTPGGEVERYQGVVLDVTEQKKAEDEVRRRNRELHVLNNIAVTFNQSFNLDEILQLSMLQVVDLFSTDTAAVYVFEEDTGSMRRKAGYGHRSEWVLQTDSFPLPQEFIQFVLQTKMEVVTRRDTPVFPAVIRQYVELEGLQSWLWVILWRKDKILGMLGTSSRTLREFTASETKVLLAVAGQLATTIEKIKLYEEARKAYDDLSRTQEQLLQSEKMSAVGQMISGVAHELNNPLTAILGYSQLLESEDIGTRVRSYLQKLQKQAQRMQKIVQNLLSFSRQHKPQRIHADLRSVLEDTLALRDFELKGNDIAVERHFDATLPLVVADPHQLEQVFLNIINNATDAMLEKAKSGILRIAIFGDDGHVVTEFHDSGPGIADPKRVFDPFYTTKGVGKGTGLGLSICYGIIKEHGGEIEALNHPQGGALIRVRIPAAVGGKPLTEGDRILARREARLAGRVLLVDGKQSVLDFERNALTAAGLEVTTLSSVESAMDVLQRDSFDVIFLDGSIAGSMTSEQLFKWIQDTRPDLGSRTVLMRSNGPENDVRVFIYSSKILCMVNPLEVSALLGVVRRVLRDTRASVILP